MSLDQELDRIFAAPASKPTGGNGEQDGRVRNGNDSKPKPAPIPPWRRFPTVTLPEPLRSFVSSAAVATQCDE